MAYPLGWSVATQLVVKRERWPGGYGAKGIPLVYPNQEVVPDQPVLRLEYTGANKRRGDTAASWSPVLSSSSGSASTKDNPAAPADGNERVPAGLHGRVVGFTRRGGVVIESQAAIVQGMIGAGNQVAGMLTIWQGAPADEPQAIPPGAILVVPGPLTFTFLHQALNSGVIGIVASSIALRDLEGFLQTDLLQLLQTSAVEQAQAHLPPLTLMLTEGIGSAIMPAYILNLLHQHQGSIGLLSGVTSVRHSISPELIISLPVTQTRQAQQVTRPDPTLSVGAQVRVCSGEREGAIGILDYFFVHEQIFRSGVRARAVRLRLEDGSFYVVPQVLVERIY